MNDVERDSFDLITRFWKEAEAYASQVTLNYLLITSGDSWSPRLCYF